MEIPREDTATQEEIPLPEVSATDHQVQADQTELPVFHDPETTPGQILLEPCDLNRHFAEVLPTIPDEEASLEGKFTWQVPKWSSLHRSRYTSPPFKLGNFYWDILLFPNGNSSNKNVAIYLEPHPISGKDGEKNDPDWYCCAQFAIIVSRPGNDAQVNLINRSHHRFNAQDTDWGFANFINVFNLKYPYKTNSLPFLNENTLNITAYIRIMKDPTGVLWHNFINYDSKKATGYVGLKNQGATCYLNSLLQSYFFTKYFRKLVYQIPTANETSSNSVSLALQRSFYLLQVSQDPLDTLELTRSFGWDSADAFTQHDVQELNRILMDRLETRMKGTPVEGKLNELFVGKMKSFVKCINVEYESSRVEDFWDLQLNVKSLKDLKESFDNYVESELLSGENQYMAQNFGLQDAEKGVIFESFPPVLHLQLKRFEYDFNYDRMIKINDRYEFPDSIDLAPYVEDKNGGKPLIYKLHGVLVHSGDVSTGHYYTMIKPDATGDEWFRFDDERVWRATKHQVFDENYGLDRLPDDKIRFLTREQYQDYLIQRHTSAYMLVYLQQEQEEKLLQPVTDADVPPHVIEMVENERKTRERLEKEISEAHLYANTGLYTLRDFVNFIGFDTVPNELFKFSYQGQPDISTSTKLSDHDQERKGSRLKLLKETKLGEFITLIKQELHLPESQPIRLWPFAYRQDNTLRIEGKPFLDEGAYGEELTLGELLKPFADSNTSSESKKDEGGNMNSTDIGVGVQRAMPTTMEIDFFVEEPYLDLQFLQRLKRSDLVRFTTIGIQLIDTIRQNIDKYIGELKAKDSLDLYPHWDPETSTLLFVKKFEPETQLLFGFGYTIFNGFSECRSLISLISGLEEADPEKIKLYEEVYPGCISPLSPESHFITEEIGSGDIISFQNGASTEDRDILHYYDFLQHRVNIRLSRVNNLKDDYVVNDTSANQTLDIWVNANISYKDLAALVGSRLDLNPEVLRLYAVYSNGKFPLNSNSNLADYLLRDYNCDLIPPFHYEVLSIPLKELEHLRPITFYWLKDSYIHYQSYDFEVSNHCTISQFIDKIQSKIGFSDEEKSDILIWTNCDFQFRGILTSETEFCQIPKQYQIFGRILPEEVRLFWQLGEHDEVTENRQISPLYEDSKKVDGSNDPSGDIVNYPPSQSQAPFEEGHLVLVSQYFKDMEYRHGISFIFNLIPNETFPQTKKRLHKEFGLGEKEFNKIKIGILYTPSHGKYKVFKSLQNYTERELEDIVLFNIMKNLDIIYLDHPDRLRSHQSGDRPMVIRS